MDRILSRTTLSAITILLASLCHNLQAKDWQVNNENSSIRYIYSLEGAAFRGRFRELKDLKPINNDESDLKVAMKMVAQTQKGPDQQIPSMGCNIKWFN